MSVVVIGCSPSIPILCILNVCTRVYLISSRIVMSYDPHAAIQVSKEDLEAVKTIGWAVQGITGYFLLMARCI